MTCSRYSYSTHLDDIMVKLNGLKVVNVMMSAVYQYLTQWDRGMLFKVTNMVVQPK